MIMKGDRRLETNGKDRDVSGGADKGFFVGDTKTGTVMLRVRCWQGDYAVKMGQFGGVQEESEDFSNRLGYLGLE